MEGQADFAGTAAAAAAAAAEVAGFVGTVAVERAADIVEVEDDSLVAAVRSASASILSTSPEPER